MSKKEKLFRERFLPCVKCTRFICHDASPFLGVVYEGKTVRDNRSEKRAFNLHKVKQNLVGVSQAVQTPPFSWAISNHVWRKADCLL